MLVERDGLRALKPLNSEQDFKLDQLEILSHGVTLSLFYLELLRKTLEFPHSVQVHVLGAFTLASVVFIQRCWELPEENGLCPTDKGTA